MPDKAKIFDMKMPLDFVIFDYNPTDITFTAGSQIAARGTPSGGGSGGSQNGFRNYILGTNPGTLNFKGLLDFHAPTCKTPPELKRRVELLFSWTQPAGGSLLGKVISAIASGGVNRTATPTVVTFQWGVPKLGFMFNGFIKSLTAKYLMFDEIGNPTRAEVTITLQEEPNLLMSLLTNPTSGGVPGRGSHLVSDGDTLQSLSQRYYGKPGYWRNIARANQIDDPLRVAPGTTLLLPAGSELDDFAE